MKVDYKYKLGYDILMDYWDCIPEEEKPKVEPIKIPEPIKDAKV